MRAAKRRKPSACCASRCRANRISPMQGSRWRTSQEARGDLAGAANTLQSTLALRPGHGGGWTNYAGVLWQMGRADEAEAALRRALGLDPASVAAWLLLGNLLRGTSRLAEALEAFAAARRLDPARFDLESAELLTLTLGDALPAAELLRPGTARSARAWRRRCPRAAHLTRWRGNRSGACASATSRATSTVTRWPGSCCRCWRGTTGRAARPSATPRAATVDEVTGAAARRGRRLARGGIAHRRGTRRRDRTRRDRRAGGPERAFRRLPPRRICAATGAGAAVLARLPATRPA